MGGCSNQTCWGPQRGLPGKSSVGSRYPVVAKWDGETGNWWDHNVVSQTEADEIFNNSSAEPTGEQTGRCMESTV